MIYRELAHYCVEENIGAVGRGEICSFTDTKLVYLFHE